MIYQFAHLMFAICLYVYIYNTFDTYTEYSSYMAQCPCMLTGACETSPYFLLWPALDSFGFASKIRFQEHDFRSTLEDY